MPRRTLWPTVAPRSSQTRQTSRCPSWLCLEVLLYSPKIPERLIPPLFRQARAEGRPMTELVAEAIERYLRDAGQLGAPEGPPSSTEDADADG